jgi:hypothetical protein
MEFNPKLNGLVKFFLVISKVVGPIFFTHLPQKLGRLSGMPRLVSVAKCLDWVVAIEVISMDWA